MPLLTNQLGEAGLRHEVAALVHAMCDLERDALIEVGKQSLASILLNISIDLIHLMSVLMCTSNLAEASLRSDLV